MATNAISVTTTDRAGAHTHLCDSRSQSAEGPRLNIPLGAIPPLAARQSNVLSPSGASAAQAAIFVEMARNDSPNCPHSTHSLTCTEMNSARSTESSPSRKAITSSGATGCDTAFIDDTLSASRDRRRVGLYLGI